MTADLNDILRPGRPLPADAVMIDKALEILEMSPHGQQLVNFVRKKEITIEILSTPAPAAYLPERKRVYIGFNRNKPISPIMFILTLAGILREAQQEAAGVKLPGADAPIEEHRKIGLEKQEDKAWFLCAVATELHRLETFRNYGFLDELSKMGYSESLALYETQRDS